MNLIVENSRYVQYYTYLDRVFSEIPELQQYNWLLSDLELNFCSDPRLSQESVVIEGASLNEILQKAHMQFIWAVLSGYIEKPQIPKKLPYADGNPHFWEGSPKPQGDGAQMEIVCWDSTCTLFINVNESIATKLRGLYPDIKDLDMENALRSNRLPNSAL